MQKNVSGEKLLDRVLDEFLTQALIDNKVEFVKLLVEMVHLKMFLTKRKVETLYLDTMKNYKDKFLERTLSTFKKKHNAAEKMENIHEAFLENLDTPAEFWNSEKSLRFSDPERELFIYSLLFMRYQMSVCFWEYMHCKTSGALFAILLTTAMLKSPEVLMDINLQKRVEVIQKDYEQKAIGLLNTCYASNPKKSHLILQFPQEFCGQKTCLDLAEQANLKTFIAQSGCQTLVREVWLGEISEKNLTWKVALAAIFPFYVYAIWLKPDTQQSLAPLKRKSANPSEGKGKLDTTNVQASTTSSGYRSSEHATISNDTKEFVAQHSLAAQVDMSDMSLIKRYQLFYKAPIVTFILNVSSKLVMLVLFSFVVITG